MSQPIAVYKVEPAPALAGWLNLLMAPVLQAIKAEAPPIEFRPLGKWGGMSAGSSDSNPDGRIKIASSMLHKSRTGLVHIIVHEMTHCLIDGVEPQIWHDHNAAFCTLNLILLRRMDDAGIDTGSAAQHACSISLYDHQDPIPHFKQMESPEAIWRPIELQWILETADKYRKSELTAKQIAEEIHKDYFDFADRVSADAENQAQKLATQKKATEQKRANELAVQRRLADEKTFFKAGFFLLLAAFSAVVYSAL